MKEKLKNKKIVYTIIGIVAVLLVAIAITYAYWLVTKTQTKENVISTGCLDITLTDEENDIALTNQFPISDEEGLTLTPYEFTVTNNCNNKLSYRVALEMLGTESEMVTSSGIKVNLNGNMGVLNAFNEIDTTVEGAYESRAIGYGALAARGNEGDSDSFELRLWIDKDASISEMKKKFRSKITVTTGQGMDSVYQEGTLAYDIVSRYGGPSAIQDLSGEWELVIFTETEYFSDLSEKYYVSDNIEIDKDTGMLTLTGQVNESSLAECVENGCGKYAIPKSNGDYSSFYVYTNFNSSYSRAHILTYERKYNTEVGTGLYKTQDNLGTSYYYRGDVENNYVKFKKNIYVPADLKDASEVCDEGDTTCFKYFEIDADIAFTSKDKCEEFGNSVGEYESCEIATEDTWWVANNMDGDCYRSKEALLKYALINSEVNINDLNDEELKELESEIGLREVSVEEVSVDLYWRIVRVNGDGTIRMIYDGDNLYENGVKHNVVTNSSLNTWYEANLKSNLNEKYIENSLFCTDDIIFYEQASDNWYAPDGSGPLYDDYYYSYYKINNLMPNVRCLNIKNNQYPIGTLSIDEIAMAGALGDTSYYLDAKTGYATENFAYAMAWLEHGGSYTYERSTNYYYSIDAQGKITTSTSNSNKRPVINLVADVPFTGSGTITDPYVISE